VAPSKYSSILYPLYVSKDKHFKLLIMDWAYGIFA